MSDETTSDDLMDALVEVRWDGKHSSAEEVVTLAISDTRGNIDALVDRIEARGTWAIWHRPDPKSAAEAWADLFSDAPEFDEAPRQAPPRPAADPEPEIVPAPPAPPTEDSLRALYAIKVLSPEEPVVSVLLDRLVAGLTEATTWGDLDDLTHELRREMGIAGVGNEAPGAWGASQLSAGIRGFAIREAP